MLKFRSIEHEEIQNAVQKFANREIQRYQTAQFYNTVPRELFEAAARSGIAGLTLPERFGGTDSPATASAVVMEELAAVDLGVAIFISVHLMVGGIIARHGTPDQQALLLPNLSSGACLGAFALTEPSSGSDAAALTTSARRDGDNYILSGEKCYITSAGFADVYIVFARTSPPSDGHRGISAFIVTKDLPGLCFGSPENKLGGELSPIASIRFDNTSVPTKNLLGRLDEGFPIALGALAGGRVNIAACALGVARSAITRSLNHLKDRKQFGQSLIDFQGLQFILADMVMKLEAARLLTHRAAETLGKAPQSRENRLHSSIAKCFASDAAMQITTDAVQLLGGAGYVKEYQVERLMREAKMLQIVEGTNQIQRMVIAREVTGL